jgi:hypothetical protein
METTVNKDLEHLKILSICYYISAALTAIFSCFPIIHLIVGIFVVTADLPLDKNGEAPPAFFGWIFIVVALIFILGGWAIAVGTFLAGRYMKEQKNWLFCIILAGLNCMFFPIGTALSVFTFIVLMRESVKALFNSQGSPSYSFNNTPDWK